MSRDPARPLPSLDRSAPQGIDEIPSANVLENESVRQGIKEYSGWPTIPQLYVKGEFVGGCDIAMQVSRPCLLVPASPRLRPRTGRPTQQLQMPWRGHRAVRH